MSINSFGAKYPTTFLNIHTERVKEQQMSTVDKILAVYSRKLITQPNFAVLTEHANAAAVDFN